MRIFTRLFRWIAFQVRDQLGFTKAEANGTLILLLLISGLLALPPFIRWYDEQYNQPTYETDMALLNSTLAFLREQQCVKKEAAIPHTTPSLQTHHTKKRNPISLDVNTVTEQSLQELQGIGATRATRIIKYRNKLGGFVRQEQYKEVYGLDARALRSMLQHTHISPNFPPKKLNINQDSFKTLVHHPYLSYEQVKCIVQYRERQEKFKDIHELIQKGIVDQVTFEKIKDYLTA
jgi:competence protein ComEA